jgi:hypothetical protein
MLDWSRLLSAESRCVMKTTSFPKHTTNHAFDKTQLGNPPRNAFGRDMTKLHQRIFVRAELPRKRHLFYVGIDQVSP